MIYNDTTCEIQTENEIYVMHFTFLYNHKNMKTEAHPKISNIITIGMPQ